MKLTFQMCAELEHIAASERAGFLGLDIDQIPSKTYLALSRRKLIKPNVDGSVSLTSLGWVKVVSCGVDCEDIND